jgi:hypothetical protein
LDNEYNKLDTEADFRDLTKYEKDRQTQVAKDLNKNWEMVEIKARQRARERQMKEGNIFM